MIAGAEVPLDAGLWACLLALTLVGIVLTALQPVLQHRREEPDVCGETDGLGRHPLGDPDSSGVRRCACGTVTSVPAAARLELVRTDTREHHWSPGLLELSSLEQARAAGHPTAWEPDAPTEERAWPRLVWPPR